MSSFTPGQNQEQPVALPQRRMKIVKRFCILATIVLFILACCYAAWEQFTPHRISQVEIGGMISNGTINGFIIFVEGRLAPPLNANFVIKSVYLVNSKEDLHFRIKLVLWDGQERELKLSVFMVNGVDSKTQIPAQLARTRQDGLVSIQVDYYDISWHGGGDKSGVGGGCRQVPVTIIEE